MNNTDLVAKLSELCDNLHDGGVSYQNYVNELASCCFSRCAKRPGKRLTAAGGYRWRDLKNELGREQHPLLSQHAGSARVDDHAIVRASSRTSTPPSPSPPSLASWSATWTSSEWFDGEKGKTATTSATCMKGCCRKRQRDQVRHRSMLHPAPADQRHHTGDAARAPRSDPGSRRWHGWLSDQADRYIKAHTRISMISTGGSGLPDEKRPSSASSWCRKTRRLALMNCLLRTISKGMTSAGHSPWQHP